MYNMIVFNAVQCERGLETTRLKVSLTVRLVSDVSIARSSVRYHIKILVCSWNVGTVRGRSIEVVEVMSKRKVDVCKR